MIAASFLLVAGLILEGVYAHGQVMQVQANGQTMPGPNIYYNGDSKNKETPVRVMYKASGPAFVLPSDFNNAQAMSCEGASGAPQTISVSPGSTLTLYWQGATGELLGQGGVSSRNPWVHAMGPIIDYITPCDNNDCSSFDAANAGWTKIAQMGIDFSQTIGGSLRSAMTNKPEKYYPTDGSGLWAMAKMVQDGSKWDIKIPEGLKAGEYIVRSEISAIHNPLNSNPTTGPQVYIACTQVKVTGDGSKTLPSGTKSSDLYSPNGDFAKYNVYSDNGKNFKMPGPALWDGASSGSSSTPSKESSSSEEQAAPTTPPASEPSSAPEAEPTTAKASPTTAAASSASPSKSCRPRSKRSLREQSLKKHRMMFQRSSF